MRFPKAKRCRSAAHWGVFLCAVLLVGAYVIFDILDVDGSQMNRWPAANIIVVVTQQAEAERFLRADLASPGWTELIRPSLWRHFSTGIGRISPATTMLRIRQSRLLPRVNLRQELARLSPPPADPA